MAFKLDGTKFKAWADDGTPLALGNVYTYEPGTSTPKPSYTSEDQSTANTNPVILDARGEADIFIDGSYKIILTDSDDVEIDTIDPVTDPAGLSKEWPHTYSASQSSSTSFTVTGNLTSIFTENRPVRVLDGTYKYGHVSSSSYSSPDTTVEVVFSSALTASVSSVSAHIIEDFDVFESLPFFYESTKADYDEVRAIPTDASGAQVGDIVHVLGFGDPWELKSGDKSADDNGWYIVSTDNPTTRYWESTSDVAEGKIFGMVSDYDTATSTGTDSTAAFNVMVAHIAANKISGYVGPGKYKVTCGDTPLYTFGDTSIDVYGAININYSDIEIVFDEAAEIALFGADEVGINYMFYTDKNLTEGTLNNIRMMGGRFDFKEQLGNTYRFASVIGVDQFTARDMRFYSSGGRQGARITLQNCRDVRLRNLDYKNTTQCLNLSYVYGLQIDNFYSDNSNEAIDFDRVVFDFECSNMHFKNASNQCWDMNSCQRGKVVNVTCEDSENPLLINFKTTTPDNYADYVNRVLPTDYTVSKDITINGMSCSNCAQGSTAIFIGNDFHTNPGQNCDNIKLLNIDLEDSGFIQSQACTNAKLENVSLKNCVGVTASGFAMVYVLKGSRVNAESSCDIRNLKIDGISVATDGLRISEASYATVDGLIIDNYLDGQDAYELTTPVSGGVYSVKNLQIKQSQKVGSHTGSNNASVLTDSSKSWVVSGFVGLTIYNKTDGSSGVITANTATTITATLSGGADDDWDASDEYYISASVGFKFISGITDITFDWDNVSISEAVTTPISITNNTGGQCLPSRKISVGDCDTTSSAKRFQVYCDGRKHAYFGEVLYSSFTLAANGVNYTNLAMKSNTSTVGSTTTTGGVSLGTQIASGFSTPESLALIEPGEAFYIEATAVGAGQKIEGFEIAAHYLDFIYE